MRWNLAMKKMKRKRLMKKSKLIYYLLAAIYGISFIFTFIMQWVSIRNPHLRWIINGSTLLLGLIAGILFYLLYQMNHKKNADIKWNEKEEDNKQNIPTAESNSTEHNVVEEQEEIFSKELYIQFADAHILTKRETQIGYLILNGYTNQQIAEELYISETTVKKHLTHIYEKTQTSGRKELKSKIKNYEKES